MSDFPSQDFDNWLTDQDRWYGPEIPIPEECSHEHVSWHGSRAECQDCGEIVNALEMTVYSRLVDDMITEFPAIISRQTLSILSLVMPYVRKCSPEDGYQVYRYTATIRELTREWWSIP